MAVPGRSGVEGWDAGDGTTRWVSRGLQSPSASTRIVEAVNSDRATVTFLDGRSGRTRAQGRAPSHPTAWLLQGRIAVLVTQGSWRTGPGQRLTALDAQTGQRVWQRRVSPGNGFGGPSGDEGVVLLDWSGRTTHAYATDTGRPLWTHDAIEAAGSGLALLHDGASLVALDLRTGRERWRVAAGPGQIAVGSGAVAVIGSTIGVFDARNGARRWTTPAPTIGARSGVPVIAGNRLLVPVPSPFYEPYDE
jgi:outer membrane protein assembly factor BamB